MRQDCDAINTDYQEIIKVREGIPQIGLYLR